MELLVDDIQEYIFSFLSLKEKINVIEVCKTFKHNIKNISILIPRMDAMIERNQSIDIRLSAEMMSIADYIYIPYRNANLEFNNIHPLYRRHRYNMKEKCIVERCRERRLDYIYSRICSIEHTCSEHYYSKRKLPYCLECFNIWHSRVRVPSFPAAL